MREGYGEEIKEREIEGRRWRREKKGREMEGREMRWEMDWREMRRKR